MRDKTLQAAAWLMSFFGVATLGAAFGTGVSMVPVKRQLDCGPLSPTHQACQGIFSQLQMASVTLFIGGLVVLAAGAVALYAVRSGGETNE